MATQELWQSKLYIFYYELRIKGGKQTMLLAWSNMKLSRVLRMTYSTHK